MAIRIPSNQAVKSKYTQGGEYILLSTHREYQGYYYELNNKLFVGKEFNINAPEIIKLTSDKINKLLLNPATETYGKISNVDLSKSKEIKSIPIASTNSEIQYFAKKLNSSPVKIICISKEDYNNNKGSNPLYSFTALQFNYEFGFIITDENLKDIPEIGFLLDDYSLLDEGDL
jgi:hypothetical protein